MRVKVRFNCEASQAPMIVDLRFLPRIGERIELGYRRVIEVLDVRRIENDNRYGGIIRAKLIQEQRRVAPPPAVPMPMPPLRIPALAVEPMPAAAAVARIEASCQLAPEPVPAQQVSTHEVSPHLATTYANLNFDELAAALLGPASSPEANLSNI